jgi:hypothetical protein
MNRRLTQTAPGSFSDQEPAAKERHVSIDIRPSAHSVRAPDERRPGGGQAPQEFAAVAGSPASGEAGLDPRERIADRRPDRRQAVATRRSGDRASSIRFDRGDDHNSAFPKNAFVNNLKRFLGEIASG